MRIEAIKLDKKTYLSMGIGLPTLPMDPSLQLSNLGKCVVIAGKNGSGKTRLLSLIQNIAKKYVPPQMREQAKNTIEQHKQSKREILKNIRSIRSETTVTAQRENQITQLKNSINFANKAIKENGQTIRLSNVLTISGEGTPKIVFFVPKSTELRDPADGVESDAIQQATLFESGLAAINSEIGAPAYVRSIMRAAIGERGSRLSNSKKTKTHAETRLLSMLRSMLGEDIEFELSDDLNLKIAGMSERYDSILSDGQKVLFQLACMLHARQASLKDCIIFLDEPENHLHPAALNEFIDQLLQALSEGQLWIATHSVPLIAHLSATESDCLWFADGGNFSRAGRAPAKVLNSLLGGHIGARRVNDLTLLASCYSSFLLLRQCLLPPGVIKYDGKDPQLDQIQIALNQRRLENQPLTVLDFGSGKGRLLDAIADTHRAAQLSKWINYIAYEPNGAAAEQCQRRCNELYINENKTRAFTSLNSIKAAYGNNFADVAIVCNVLHEVHPAQWLREFGGSSPLAKITKKEGHILFVEDYAIPVGERAHEYGFLLLDEPELKLLFNIKDEDVEQGLFTRTKHVEQKYRGRLIAHSVAASCLKRMNKITILRAIQSLHDRSLTRLQGLLKVEHNEQTSAELGRESALVTQLIANSALWLRDQSQKKPTPNQVKPALTYYVL